MPMTPLSAVVSQHATRWPSPNADLLLNRYDELRGMRLAIQGARDAMQHIADIDGHEPFAAISDVREAVLKCDAALVKIVRRMAQIDTRLAELGVANPLRG